MNMNYCAVNNTNLDLGQVLSMIHEYGSIEAWKESLSSSEAEAWDSLVDKVFEIADLVSEEENEGYEGEE